MSDKKRAMNVVNALIAERDEARADVAELTQALEAAQDWLARFEEHAPIVFGGEAELGRQIDAALAKARGESNE